MKLARALQTAVEDNLIMREAAHSDLEAMARVHCAATESLKAYYEAFYKNSLYSVHRSLANLVLNEPTITILVAEIETRVLGFLHYGWIGPNGFPMSTPRASWQAEKAYGQAIAIRPALKGI